MPIAKMKRLQVLALERDHDALLRQLEDGSFTVTVPLETRL